jgi:hypothetical protein
VGTVTVRLPASRKRAASGQDILLPNAKILLQRKELQHAAAPNIYPAEMVSTVSTVPPLSNEAEDVVVSKELRRDQNQGHNCESDLDLFSPKAPV